MGSDPSSSRLQDLRPETVQFYVWRRWTRSHWPKTEFDPASGSPPLTMAGVEVGSPVLIGGRRGTGPFERVLVKKEGA